MNLRQITLSALAAALLGAAPFVAPRTPTTTEACSAGTVSRLYLGQSTPDGVVAEAQWDRFVADAVTVRFPDGFTELRAQGHWRDGSGRTQEEHTRILEIAHADAAADHDRIRAIAADYRTRFAQQSVLVTQTAARNCLANAG